MDTDDSAAVDPESDDDTDAEGFVEWVRGNARAVTVVDAEIPACFGSHPELEADFLGFIEAALISALPHSLNSAPGGDERMFCPGADVASQLAVNAEFLRRTLREIGIGPECGFLGARS